MSDELERVTILFDSGTMVSYNITRSELTNLIRAYEYALSNPRKASRTAVYKVQDDMGMPRRLVVCFEKVACIG